MILRVRPQANEAKKAAIVAEFYREQIRTAVSSLVKKWTARMGITVHRLYVQQMKTKWGSCNPLSRAIRLNTELAKKPKHCLEYILVHELVHFFEPHHGDRFVSFMDKFMPQWRQHREELNWHPLSHESWSY